MFDALTLSQIPPQDEALRPAIRAFIAETCASMTLPERARSWMGVDAEFSRKLGAAGYLGLTLPKAYGGHERGPFARFVVIEELLAAGAPVGLHWIGDRQSSQLILKFGSEAQKRFFLPRMCRGEMFFCIGMSEPGSGSDLASVRTHAERTETGWRLNGQKIWTTNAHLSQYAVVLARTSGGPEDRHKGLSQLVVDLALPGVTARPILDLNGDADFNEVFYDNVALPADALLGEEGAGWEQVNAELAFERSGPERIYSVLALVDAWIRHVHALGQVSEPRLRLAGTMTAQLATLRQISIAVTARLVAGENPLTEASLSKDLGTSFEQELPHLIGDDLAAYPDEPIPADLRATLFQVMQVSPAFSLRGGTREIMRGIIARGLGLR